MALVVPTREKTDAGQAVLGTIDQMMTPECTEQSMVVGLIDRVEFKRVQFVWLRRGKFAKSLPVPVI